MSLRPSSPCSPRQGEHRPPPSCERRVRHSADRSLPSEPPYTWRRRRRDLARGNLISALRGRTWPVWQQSGVLLRSQGPTHHRVRNIMERTTSVPTTRLPCHKFHPLGSATAGGQLTMRARAYCRSAGGEPRFETTRPLGPRHADRATSFIPWGRRQPVDNSPRGAWVYGTGVEV